MHEIAYFEEFCLKCEERVRMTRVPNRDALMCEHEHEVTGLEIERWKRRASL